MGLAVVLAAMVASASLAVTTTSTGAPSSPGLCSITDSGAIHGESEQHTARNTQAINHAITTCHTRFPHSAVVYVPRGTWRTGSINLTSNLTLRLGAGATLLSTNDELHYGQVPCLPNESREPIRNQGFIGCWNCSNTAIEGMGGGAGGSVIDGNGPVWNNYTTTHRNEVHVHKYARPFLINPMYCANFRITGVHLKDSAFWTFTPFVCDGVYVADVNITSENAAGNTDGIHPDASRNMLVERVHVSVGDDAVAITSGEMYQGRTFGIPAENMLFRDSVFLHRFFAIGSGTAAGVRNITVENCQLGAAPGDGFGSHYGPSDDAGINIKTERGNGGWIEDIVFKNLVIHGRVDEWDLLPATPIRVALIYAYNDSVKPPTNVSATPKLRKVSFENIKAFASCEPDYWRPRTTLPSRCGDNSSIAWGAKARIAPGVFWGLNDSVMTEISLRNVSVVTANPTNAPWRCDHADIVTATDVTPLLVCDKSRGKPTAQQEQEREWVKFW